MDSKEPETNLAKMQNDFSKLSKRIEWEAPQLFEVTDQESLNPLLELLNSGKVTRFYDSMDFAAKELYDIEYPQEKDLKDEQKSNFEQFKTKFDWPKGTFVFFPWDRTLIRFPSKSELRALRTSRNRNLITKEEQEKLYGATIFIAGLSVGSNIVETLVSMGIGGKFVLADMDVIEPSNLNRIRAPYKDVGTHKADSVAMHMSEIDPFLEFVLEREGLNEANLTQILDEHKPAIIIDEMDQVQLKIKLRKEAKKRGIAVLSAADDGDSALLDIERYDSDPDYPIYHGLIPDKILNFLESAKEIPRQQLGLLIGKYFVGSKNIPLRMYQSLNEVGKTLPSWPQLGGSAAQSGIVVAYACRQIIIDQPLKQGRFIIGPDQVINPLLDDDHHQKELEIFQKQLDSFELT